MDLSPQAKSRDQSLWGQKLLPGGGEGLCIPPLQPIILKAPSKEQFSRGVAHFYSWGPPVQPIFRFALFSSGWLSDSFQISLCFGGGRDRSTPLPSSPPWVCGCYTNITAPSSKDKLCCSVLEFFQITETWIYVPLFEILHIPPCIRNAPGMPLRNHEAPQTGIGGEKGCFFP